MVIELNFVPHCVKNAPKCSNSMEEIKNVVETRSYHLPSTETPDLKTLLVCLGNVSFSQKGSHSFVQKNFQDFSRPFQYPKNIFQDSLIHLAAMQKVNIIQRQNTWMYYAVEMCGEWVSNWVLRVTEQLSYSVKMWARAYFGICTYTYIIVSASCVIA